jgi:hypothetical protein
LETDADDERPYIGARQHRIHPFDLRTLDGAQPDFRLPAFLLEERPEIFANESP